ncbi:MAG TPA: hypothetical protein VIH41_01030, partial [Myxococcales bacterium]
MDTPDRLRGSALGLASALLFGLGAPVSKLLLPGTQPLVLAALLYLGAGPVLMLFGLARLSGLAGSLLLNLETPFTIALAVLVFGEHL